MLLNSSGIITCVAKDCSTTAGAADASVVDCADGVISPGLINPHDHITYANNKPHNGTTRYEYHEDWCMGTNGGNKISVQVRRDEEPGPCPRAAHGDERHDLDHQRRRPGGLLRNLDVGNLKEGLPIQTVDSDTFPLTTSERNAGHERLQLWLGQAPRPPT